MATLAAKPGHLASEHSDDCGSNCVERAVGVPRLAPDSRFRSLARRGRGAASGRCRSLRSADGSHLAAAATAAEELIAAIGFEPRHANARRHVETFQDLSSLRIDPPHIALFAFHGAVPEFAVDPCDAGDEAVGLDGAKDRSGLRIDLMNPAIAVLP